MYRRATALAVLALAGMRGVAAAATEVNVIPHGQQQPGVPWASVPGMLPADAQARMYDRLTPFGADVTDAMLRPSADGRGFFKSAALKPVDDPSFLTDETITATAGGRALTARIRRDAYGVPNVYSDADDGVIFGAGYVTAQDRSLLLDQVRDNGIAGAIDLPGAPAIQLVLGLYRYTPTARVRRQVVARQDRALRAAGTKGRQVLRDIDTYLVGINHWYRRNRPDARPFDRGDMYAVNAIKAQFLGQGGGDEVPNALFLDAARDRFGKGKGSEVYEDLRQRDDPETSTTTARRAAVRVPAGPGGVERPARRRGALGHRDADHGRRPAARLQLPRPDHGDRPARADPAGRGRDVRAVPRLPADRPRRAVRVDAHLGGRRHHRHLRRDAVRRVAHAVPLQGPLPADGDREGRHDHPRRGPRAGDVPPHRPRPRGRLRAGRGLGTHRRAGPEALERRPGDERPDLLPGPVVRPRSLRAGLHPGLPGDPADVQLVLRRREGHRVRHDRTAAEAAEGRQRGPAGRRARAPRVERLRGRGEAPAGFEPRRRAAGE